MTADAFSDAVLCLCALWLMRANGRQQQGGLGLACGVIGVAAMLGVLRFSNWTAASQAVAGTHQFLSLLGAVGAFPLLAYALAYPHSPLARRFSGAFWMMFSVGGLGLAVVLLGAKVWGQVVPVLSVLWIAHTVVRRWPGARRWRGLLGVLALLAGFAATLLMPRPDSLWLGWLSRMEILHYTLAAALLLLAWPVSRWHRS